MLACLMYRNPTINVNIHREAAPAMRSGVAVCIVIYNLSRIIWAQNAENFLVENYAWCPNVFDPPTKLYITLKKFEKGAQIIDANLSSTTPIGENTWLTVHLQVESKLKKDHWIPLITIEDDFCRAFQMYIGEFWYELQMAAAVAPRSCPIPRGVYHVTNHKLDFTKLKLQTFPFGRLKVRMQTQHKLTKQVLSCGIGIIRNAPSG